MLEVKIGLIKNVLLSRPLIGYDVTN